MEAPAEWEPHDAVWLAWPEGEELWDGHLEAVRREWVALCRAIRDVDTAGGAERLFIVTRDAESEAMASDALGPLDARFHHIPYGDIWLRDTAPVLCRDGGMALAAVCFDFNGWGGKYLFDGDRELSRRLAAANGFRVHEPGLILEGGALEVDGQGTVLTTEDCVLDAARNRTTAREAIEERLGRALGTSTTLWLRGRLARDHTDGHIDTLARFVAPGRVLCMRASDSTDPNKEVLDEIRRQLASMHDAQGRPLEVLEIPSPGRVDDDAGLPLPASYLNYYIANGRVVVPVYDSAYDAAAVDAISDCFSESGTAGAAAGPRPVMGLPARHLVTGGGAFHCITQQQPAVREFPGAGGGEGQRGPEEHP